MIPNKTPVENLTREQAEILAGRDANALTRDLHNEIAGRRYPSWKVYAQVVQPDEVANFPVNIFDPNLEVAIG